MTIRYVHLLLLFLPLSVQPANAQHAKKHKPKAENSYYHTPQDWYREHTGIPIHIDTVLTAADGKVIDFRRLQRPAFVNFGFYGCHPCEHELPVYIKASERYPDVDFIYITFDREDIRQREFRETIGDGFKPGKNYYIIHMEEPEILRRDLTLGYPTKYFIDAKGVVRMVISGGSDSAPEAQIMARITALINGNYEAATK